MQMTLERRPFAKADVQPVDTRSSYEPCVWPCRTRQLLLPSRLPCFRLSWLVSKHNWLPNMMPSRRPTTLRCKLRYRIAAHMANAFDLTAQRMLCILEWHGLCASDMGVAAHHLSLLVIAASTTAAGLSSQQLMHFCVQQSSQLDLEGSMV